MAGCGDVRVRERLTTIMANPAAVSKKVGVGNSPNLVHPRHKAAGVKTTKGAVGNSPNLVHPRHKAAGVKTTKGAVACRVVEARQRKF